MKHFVDWLMLLLTDLSNYWVISKIKVIIDILVLRYFGFEIFCYDILVYDILFCDILFFDILILIFWNF